MKWAATGLLLIVALQIGCDREGRPPFVAGTSSDSSGVEIIELHSLPSLTDPDFLWQLELVASLATVDESGTPRVFNPTYLLPLENEVVVVDPAGEQAVVSLHRTSGEVRWRFGRFGGGPDELSKGLRLVRFGDDLGLVDLGRGTIRKFDSEGKVKSRSNLSLSGRLRQVEQGSDGSIFAETWIWKGIGDLGATLFTFGEDGFGAAIASVPPPGVEPGVSAIQGGKGMWAPVAGGVVITNSMVPAFAFIDATGIHRRTIRLQLTAREMTEAELNRRRAGPYGGLASLYRVGPIATANEMYPLSDTIFATWHSNMWRAAEDPLLEEEEFVLRLISTSGNYLGAALLPSDFLTYWSGGGMIWGRRLDSTGTPVIEGYELRPPGAS